MSTLCCCCCTQGDSEKGVPEVDYLLPGGAWDPNISASASASSPIRTTNRSLGDAASSSHHHSSSSSRAGRISAGGKASSYSSSLRSFWTKRFRSSRSSQSSRAGREGYVGGGDDAGGDYQPPPVVPSKTLPTCEDFKLLKTVGRGAFGKVGKM